MRIGDIRAFQACRKGRIGSARAFRRLIARQNPRCSFLLRFRPTLGARWEVGGDEKDVNGLLCARFVFVLAVLSPLSSRVRFQGRRRAFFLCMRCRAFLRFDASGEPPLVLFKSAKLTQSFFRVCSCWGLRSLVHGRCGQKDPRKYRARPVRAWRIL